MAPKRTLSHVSNTSSDEDSDCCIRKQPEINDSISVRGVETSSPMTEADGCIALSFLTVAQLQAVARKTSWRPSTKRNAQLVQFMARQNFKIPPEAFDKWERHGLILRERSNIQDWRDLTPTVGSKPTPGQILLMLLPDNCPLGLRDREDVW